MIKNFAANLKIGAVMGSSVGRVFQGVNKRIKGQEAELKRLRAAYKEASKGTGEYAGKLDELQREIKETEERIKRLRGASKIKMGDLFKGVGDSFKGDLGRLGKVAGVASAAIIGTGTAIYGVTRSFVDWADDIGDTAEALKLSTQALQTWQFAAATVGVGGSKMTASIAKFSKTVADGGKKTDQTLSKLGINAVRLRKLGLDDQLSVVAEAFKNYRGNIPRATLAMKLFGKSGYQLAGVLAQGEEGLRKFREEGEAVGAVLDDAAMDKAGDAAAALDMLGITMIGLRNTIAIEFVPVLKDMAEQFIKFIKNNREDIRKFFKDFADTIKTKVVPAVGDFLKQLPGMIKQIGDLASKFWKGLTAVKDFVGGWENLGIALLALNFAPTIIAVGSLVKGLWGLVSVLWATSGASWAAVGPWALLAGLIAGFVAIVMNLDTVGEKMNDFWDWIYGDGVSEKVGNALFELQLAFEEFGLVFVKLNRDGLKRSADLWEGIKSGASTAATVIRDVFEAVLNWLGEKFDVVGQKIASMWEGTKNLGRSVMEFFGLGSSPTASTAPALTPADAMPARSPSQTQNNSFSINVNAPGGDGRRIADSIRSEFNRKPLYDMDSFMSPATP